MAKVWVFDVVITVAGEIQLGQEFVLDAETRSYNRCLERLNGVLSRRCNPGDGFEIKSVVLKEIEPDGNTTPTNARMGENSEII